MDEGKLKRKKEKALHEKNYEHVFSYCNDLAEFYVKTEEYDLALKEYKEAENIAKKLNNDIFIALCHRMIGETLCLLGNFKEAIEHQDLYLKISQNKGNTIEKQRALASLGRTYFVWAESIDDESEEHKSHLKSSRKFYNKSLDICEKLVSEISQKQISEMKSRLFLNLGLTLEAEGDVKTGIEYITKAINISKHSEFWEDLCRCYISQGSLYFRHNDISKAMSAFDEGLKVATRLEDKVQLSSELLSLKSDVLIKLSDYNGAKDVLFKAYKMKQLNIKDKKDIEKKLKIIVKMCRSEKELLQISENDYFKRKTVNENLGDYCVKLKNYEKAIEYYHKMLEYSLKMNLEEKDLIPIYYSLSQTYKDNKEYKLSLQYAEKEYNLIRDNPSEACKSLLNIIETMELLKEDFEKITERYQKALTLAKKSGDFKLEKSVLQNMIKTATTYNRMDLISEMQEELDMINSCLPNDELDLEYENSESEEMSPNDEELNINLSELSDINTDSDDEVSRSDKRTRRKVTKSSLTRRNDKGETPLHIACAKGNVKLINSLIKQGHPINIQDAAGWTPLHEACNHGQLEAVRILIDANANLNDRGGPKCDGITPLHDAASNGHLEIMELLLDSGASPLARTNKGETILDCLLACRNRVESEGDRLDVFTLAHFDEIVKRLRECLNKVGHDSQKSIFYNDIQTNKKVSCLQSNEKQKVHKMIDRRQRITDASPVKITNAAEDYQNTVQALRHRNKRTENDHQLKPIEKAEKPALLSSGDVGDDWLEDDMAELSKRPIKRHCEEFIGHQIRASKKTLSTSSQLTKKKFSTPVKSRWDDEFDDLERVPRVSNNDAVTSSSSKISLETDNFIDEVQNSSFVDEMNYSTNNYSWKSNDLFDHEKNLRDHVDKFTPLSASTQVDPSSESNNVRREQIFSSHQNFSHSSPRMQSIKVRIEGKLFLVPIPGNKDLDQLNIGWLISEAARRYKNIEGISPILNLTTDDGALLDENDSLSILYGRNEVCGVISSWNLPPLVDRYKDVCAVSKAVPDKYFEKQLDICQASMCLEIKNSFVSMDSLMPVLKTISFHQNLQKLCITEMNLQDQEFKAVLDNISKLIYLYSLDVSVNSITHDGLSYFSSIIGTQSSFQSLEELDISYNPLNDESIHYLANITQRLPNLRRLNITYCNLTAQSLYYSTFSLDSLESLEIAYNQLERAGAAAFLSCLDTNKIRVLDLSNTGSSEVFREFLLFIERGHPDRLETLKLSNLNLDDNDVEQLSEQLNMAEKLVNLDLSNNPGISANSHKHLLKLVNLKQLNLSGCDLMNAPSEILFAVPQTMLSGTFHNNVLKEAPYSFLTSISNLNIL